MNIVTYLLCEDAYPQDKENSKINAYYNILCYLNDPKKYLEDSKVVHRTDSSSEIEFRNMIISYSDRGPNKLSQLPDDVVCQFNKEDFNFQKLVLEVLLIKKDFISPKYPDNIDRINYDSMVQKLDSAHKANVKITQPRENRDITIDVHGVDIQPGTKRKLEGNNIEQSLNDREIESELSRDITSRDKKYKPSDTDSDSKQSLNNGEENSKLSSDIATRATRSSNSR